ncbi:nitroreductase family protein [bacterium]|nr:nitroreductase family protein [bacterium]
MIIDIITPILERRSVRKFAERPVEREKILTCLHAAQLAPSAENVQPWRFIVIDDPAVRDAFSKQVFSGIYSATRWAAKAPVLIALAADRNIIAHGVAAALQKIPYYMIDIGICGEHIVLQAQHMGLGSCWIGWFNARKADTFFRLPAKMRICELIALGYPEKSHAPRNKKLKNGGNMIQFNTWT